MTLQLYKGNRLPILTDNLTIAGTAYDLSGSTVLFSMRNSNTAVLKVNGSTATVVSPTTGAISYAWATGDTDTVGEYLAWWSVNTGGKLQDTQEFAIVVIEHTPSSIEIVYPVAPSGKTTIYQGDSYLAANSRQLVYQVETMDAPTLSGSTVVYRIEGQNHYTMSIVDKDSVYLELTSTQTAALPANTYNFEIKWTSGGNSITLMRNTITINPIMVSP